MVQFVLLTATIDFKIIEQDRNIPYTLSPAVNQLDARPHHILNNRPKQRIMSTAQDKGVHLARQRMEGLIDHLFGQAGLELI